MSNSSTLRRRQRLRSLCGEIQAKRIASSAYWRQSSPGLTVFDHPVALAGTFFYLETHSIRSCRHIQRSDNNSDESHHHSAPSAKEVVTVEESKPVR
jgi:hypothetical protein